MYQYHIFLAATGKSKILNKCTEAISSAHVLGKGRCLSRNSIQVGAGSPGRHPQDLQTSVELVSLQSFLKGGQAEQGGRLGLNCTKCSKNQEMKYQHVKLPGWDTKFQWKVCHGGKGFLYIKDHGLPHRGR